MKTLSAHIISIFKTPSPPQKKRHHVNIQRLTWMAKYEFKQDDDNNDDNFYFLAYALVLPLSFNSIDKRKKKS